LLQVQPKSSPKSVEKLKILLGSPPIAKLKITPEKLGKGKEKKNRRKSRPSPENNKTAVPHTVPSPPVGTTSGTAVPKVRKPLFRAKSLSASPPVEESPSCVASQQQQSTGGRPYSSFKLRNSGGDGGSGCSGSGSGGGSSSGSGGTGSSGSGGSQQKEAKYSIFKSRNSEKGGSSAASRLTIDVIAAPSGGGSGPAALQFGRREKTTATSSAAAFADWEEDEPPTTTLAAAEGSRRLAGSGGTSRSPARAAQALTSLEEEDGGGKTSLLEIDVLEDEFSSVRVAESPNTKVRVVDHQSPSPAGCSPRKLVFSLHSPICQDEIRPMEGGAANCPPLVPIPEPMVTYRGHGAPQRDSPQAEKGVRRPALRTHGRVISSEDALMAIDAVVVPEEVPPTAHAPPTPTLPVLSPHGMTRGEGRRPDEEGGEAGQATHSNMTTPSLPSLSPACVLNSVDPPLRQLPPPPASDSHSSSQLFSPPSQHLKSKAKTAKKTSTTIIAPSSSTKAEILPASGLVTDTERRKSTSSEGTLAAMDPHISLPLSLEIPAETAQQQRDDGSANQIKPTDGKKARRKSSTAASLAAADVAYYVAVTPPRATTTTTGRQMRDCRKFIHYEFSPPFVISSDDSSTDQESPVSSGGAVYRDATHPTGSGKRGGRQPKVKPLDSVAAKRLPKNAGRGRPKGAGKGDVAPAPNAAVGAGDKDVSVSELAQRLAEDHISPITRERLSFFTGERRGSLDTSR